MRETSEQGFFLAKAQEAEEKAARAFQAEERKTWHGIAVEYRLLATLEPSPRARPLLG